MMVGPKGSEAPLVVRQNVYIFDAHPRASDELTMPQYKGWQPFLYVMEGEVAIGNLTIGKKEAVTDIACSLPHLTANVDSTIVLFLVDMDAHMSLAGTISGLKKVDVN